MQKRIIVDSQPDSACLTTQYLNLQALADVEVTSENSEHPIEAALLPGFVGGWRAETAGKQTIRLLFKQAQPIHGIELGFLDTATSRTQEYVIRVSLDNGQSFLEIVRQQWNFNPQNATTESEQHCVDLAAVTTIDLNINPDIGNPDALASLEYLRVF